MTLQLLSRQRGKIQAATVFLARYIIRSITIKLTTHVEVFPPGFDALPWLHLNDWFNITKGFIFETADWCVRVSIIENTINKQTHFEKEIYGRLASIFLFLSFFDLFLTHCTKKQLQVHQKIA